MIPHCLDGVENIMAPWWPSAVVERTVPGGTWVQTGVYLGYSARKLNALRGKQTPAPELYLFDSFEGLPQEWDRGGGDVRSKGYFKCDPPFIKGTHTVVGLVENTLATFRPPSPITLLHIDTDLYSPCMAALTHLEAHLAPGALIVFDELYGYARAEHYELGAYLDWLPTTRAKTEFILRCDDKGLAVLRYGG